MWSPSLLWKILLVLLTCGSNLQVTLSQNINISLNDWSAVGQDSTILCIGVTDVLLFQWTKTILNETILLYEEFGGSVDPGPDIDPTHYEFVSSGDYPLTIKSIVLEDAASYSCSLRGTGGSTLSDIKYLNIRDPPDANDTSLTYRDVAYNNGSTIDVIAGEGRVFSFTLVGIKPKANFSWYLDDDPVTVGVVSSHTAQGVLVDSASNLTIDLKSGTTKILKVTAGNYPLNPSSIDVVFIVNLNIESTTEAPTEKQTTPDLTGTTPQESPTDQAPLFTSMEPGNSMAETTTDGSVETTTVGLGDPGLSLGAKIAIGVVCGIAGIAAMCGGVAVALHFHGKKPAKVGAQPSTIGTGDNDKATVAAQPSTNGTEK